MKNGKHTITQKHLRSALQNTSTLNLQIGFLQTVLNSK